MVTILAAASVASACAATPTIVPTEITIAEPETQQESVPQFDVTDERIDFNLTRGDVDCSTQALTVETNTEVQSAHFVVDGKLGARCFGRTSSVLVDSWKLIARLTPPKHLKEVGLFVGYTSTVPTEPGTTFVGFASSLGWRAAGAQISIDLDHAFDPASQLTRTLIHEMGHVVTLARSESSRLQPGYACESFARRDSCFLSYSVLSLWVDQFWSPEQLAQLDPDDVPSPNVGQHRCDTDEGFWNAYSASSPVEDIAESYASFVLGFNPQNDGQQARHDFFAQYPEFAEARQRAVQLEYGGYTGYGRQCG